MNVKVNIDNRSYDEIFKSFEPMPNYIPVKNMADFNYDVIAFYNQYYASPKTTQRRRLLRNYISNNQVIKQYNQNPFINNKGKTFNFLYTYDQNYMIVQTKETTTLYIYINKCWCKMGIFDNKTECYKFITLINNKRKIDEFNPVN